MQIRVAGGFVATDTEMMLVDEFAAEVAAVCDDQEGDEHKKKRENGDLRVVPFHEVQEEADDRERRRDQVENRVRIRGRVCLWGIGRDVRSLGGARNRGQHRADHSDEQCNRRRLHPGVVSRRERDDIEQYRTGDQCDWEMHEGRVERAAEPAALQKCFYVDTFVRERLLMPQSAYSMPEKGWSSEFEVRSSTFR